MTWDALFQLLSFLFEQPFPAATFSSFLLSLLLQFLDLRFGNTRRNHCSIVVVGTKSSRLYRVV